jgi:hypothetical protein
VRARIHRQPSTLCPCCGMLLDAHVVAAQPDPDDPEDRGPAAGDFTMCVYCMAPLTYLGGPGWYTLRRATEKEIAEDRATFDGMRTAIFRMRLAP